MAGKSKWNQPNEGGRAKVRRPRTRLVVWAAVGVAFAICAFLAARFAMEEDDVGVVPAKAENPKPIAEAVPAKAPRAAPEAAERRRQLTPLEKARLAPMHTNAYGYVINRPHTKVIHTNDQALAMLSEAERVFSNTADRKIASLLTIEPGEMLVGDPSRLFGRGFRRKFLESLEQPELILETDSEDVRALKQAVIDAKADLKARMDAGEDVCEVMLQAYREAQEIGLYRENLKAEVSRLARDRALGEDEVKDFVAAANKMLSGRGAKPLTMPRAAARRLQLMKDKEVR